MSSTEVSFAKDAMYRAHDFESSADAMAWIERHYMTWTAHVQVVTYGDGRQVWHVVVESPNVAGWVVNS